MFIDQETRIKFLERLNPYRQVFAILCEWVIIAASIKVSLILQNPYVDFICLLMIASRQHALLVIMHDGAHYLISKNSRINDFVSDFFCAFPNLVTTKVFRYQHLQHHKFLNTENDPNYVTKKGPIWRYPKKSRFEFGVTLCVLYIKSLYQGRWISTYYYFKRRKYKDSFELSYGVTSFVIYSLIIYHFFSLKNIWFYWLVPTLFIFPFISLFRSIVEHQGVDPKNEICAARDVYVPLFERVFISPRCVNYHLTHHLYPLVPHYNLPLVHKILLENSRFREVAKINSSYLLPSKQPVLKDLVS